MRRPALFTVFAFTSLCASLSLLPTATSAATGFEGPPGWTRTDVGSPTPTRTISQWQIAGDTSTSITFIQDSSITYAATLAAMSKNFSDNAIKLAVNKDIACVGGTGHVVEFTAGPDGSRTIFNRLVLPEGEGVATLTYTRADGNAFDDDVRKAEAAFCASALDPKSFPPPAPAATPAPSPAATPT
jgi:hypothetical protein